jgi:hypothetical protein
MISNLIKIHPAGAELFHVDERMDGRETEKNDEASNSVFKGGTASYTPRLPANPCSNYLYHCILRLFDLRRRNLSVTKLMMASFLIKFPSFLARCFHQ